MPFVARARPLAPQLLRILLPKLATLLPDGFVGDGDTTLEQEFLHVTVTHTKAKVEPHRMADNFDREAMILVKVG
jgi:hypothetical protein